jgi:hypothetical protein
MKRFVAVTSTLLGAGLLVAGATMLAVPAGLILAGVLLAAFGMLAVDLEEK